MCSKDYIIAFQPGAFSSLSGVQNMNFNYKKDLITNIDVSNARGQIVDLLLWIARSYTIIEVEYLEPLIYKGDNVDLDYSDENSLKNSVDRNKDKLKE